MSGGMYFGDQGLGDRACAIGAWGTSRPATPVAKISSGASSADRPIADFAFSILMYATALGEVPFPPKAGMHERRHSLR